MRVAYLGNFTPPFSTENHIAGSFELLGHTITRIQEGDTPAADVPNLARNHDLFLHTQTYDLAVRTGTEPERAAMYSAIRTHRIPTVGIHLDRWFDLSRESQLTTDPYFRGLDYLFTADGGNQDRFTQLSINHHYLPPAVFAPECILGTANPNYRSQVAFVGNWRGAYHPESRHRHELINFLRRTYRTQVRFWPRGGSIRGQQLSDLYASVPVIVGDSALVGTGLNTLYWSDRIPETLGRGGFLIHPYVPGIEAHYKDGEHLILYEPFNWADLRDKISYYLRHQSERDEIRLAGFEHVKSTHTYTHRIAEVLSTILAGNPHLRPVRERIEIRPNTTDEAVATEIFDEQVYRAADYIHPGSVVIDLGANVGMFTIYAADRGARVIAVEPFPENVDQLRKNLMAAGVSDQVAVVPAACGDSNGHCEVVPGDFGGRDISARSGDSFTQAPTGQHTIVPTIDLDTLLAPYDSIAVLKLDVEGAEYPIFEAASDSTMRKIAYISMEFHGESGNMLHGRKLKSGSFGRMIEKIAATHGVTILGRAPIGGYVFAKLY